MLLALSVDNHSDRLLDSVLTRWLDTLDRIAPLHNEGYHNAVWLVIFVHLPQPRASLYRVARLSNRRKVPLPSRV